MFAIIYVSLIKLHMSEVTLFTVLGAFVHVH